MGDQRDWVALQDQLLRTLERHGVLDADQPLTRREAGDLADSLADDVYAMFDLTPRRSGVGSRVDDHLPRRRLRWLGRP